MARRASGAAAGGAVQRRGVGVVFPANSRSGRSSSLGERVKMLALGCGGQRAAHCAGAGPGGRGGCARPDLGHEGWLWGRSRRSCRVGVTGMWRSWAWWLGSRPQEVASAGVVRQSREVCSCGAAVQGGVWSSSLLVEVCCNAATVQGGAASVS
jgi:hypothetical protein